MTLYDTDQEVFFGAEGSKAFLRDVLDLAPGVNPADSRRAVHHARFFFIMKPR